ncbi:ABC transporter substrate-binding protein [Ahrensia marina]|uniref:ABC transporter substrate-binding protein n=1 Tax=Ahrensia marina TaxID=1514904 RepID=UPI0035CF8E6B
MRLFSLFAMLLTLAVSVQARASDERTMRPERVVSLNMCTDQLLLALADPNQIVGLSRFAGNGRLSYAAEQAAAYPQLPAAAEAVIALEPDMVLTGLFTNRAAKDMLARFDYRVEEVPFSRSLEEAYAAIRLVAEMVGHPQRGQVLIDQIDAALSAARSDEQLTALIIRRRGYATGIESLIGDLLAQLGMPLASERLVGARGGFADLETIIRAEPDVLITPTLTRQGEDQGSALLAHRALNERYPPSRRIAMPERLTLCAGPSLIEAIETIANERDQALQRLAGG